MLRREKPGLERVWMAALAYVGVTVAMTWPLARNLGRDVAFDLGDPLYSMWAIAWNCTRFLGILGGDLTKAHGFFNANIFYPEPLALAYSDHMMAQSAQVLPLYALGGNVVLCYNVIFLSTFVLSGLGTYLFVRELTGCARAAFAAGLMFAFAPYRMGHLAHLNLLSAHWAPFALYGLRRYFDTRRYRPLAGAAVALILQNLSSGYYVLYVLPFVALYVLWEVVARRAWFASRMWLELLTVAAVVTAATVPFLAPYFDLRNRLPALRDAQEVARHSADVYAYLTAPASLGLWGRVLRIYPRSEGELFPGLLPLALAGVAVTVWAHAARGSVASSEKTSPTPTRVWLARALFAVSLAYGLLTACVIFLRRVAIPLGAVKVSANNVSRLLAFGLAALALGLTASQRARQTAGRLARSPEAWALTMLVGAWTLSLGPAPTVLGRRLQIAAPYGWLLDHVPGFAGARAPARLAMIVALALAVLAGFGFRAIEHRWGRWTGVAAAFAFLVEAAVLPFPVNVVAPIADLTTPEARVHRRADAPEVYRAVERLQAHAVLIEFPFGRPDYDRRSMYYSTFHWRRLVNGYSAFYPPDYDAFARSLSEFHEQPHLAGKALRRRGVTHALVHERAYPELEGARVSAWLRELGATEVFHGEGDALFQLPERLPASLQSPSALARHRHLVRRAR